MKLLGLDHVQLAMPAGQESKARQFYGGLLGLREIAKPEALAIRGGCWFEGPGIQLHLGVQDKDFVPAKKAHPALLVDDLEDCRSRLIAAGVPVVPDDSVPGLRRFYAGDPFGNRLEFIQDGDGFSQQA
ncbi:MAG TPA: VOC family protein [Anaerolineae bacterium]|nr:VOC family protein [Anaerolineae bacterium]HMR64807.1 VOC family protein [Anaerolineae bacterium]